jgi:hypothetical protein
VGIGEQYVSLLGWREEVPGQVLRLHGVCNEVSAIVPKNGGVYQRPRSRNNIPGHEKRVKVGRTRLCWDRPPLQDATERKRKLAYRDVGRRDE